MARSAPRGRRRTTLGGGSASGLQRADPATSKPHLLDLTTTLPQRTDLGGGDAQVLTALFSSCLQGSDSGATQGMMQHHPSLGSRGCCVVFPDEEPWQLCSAGDVYAWTQQQRYRQDSPPTPSNKRRCSELSPMAHKEQFTDMNKALERIGPT